MVAIKAAASLARKAKALKKKFKGDPEGLKKAKEKLYGGPKKTETKTRKVDLTAEERTTARSRKQKAKEYKAMPKKDRREVRRMELAQEIDDALTKNKRKTSGGTRALSLSKEGRKLADSDNPADQAKLLKSLRAKGERSPYVRHPLDSPLRAKGTELSPEEIRKLPPAEEIEHRLHRSPPLLTRGQAGRAVRGREMPIDPEDIKTGFQEFKKGGMSRKKYQSTNKYGGKDYVYLGGGLVGDIMHFKKKRGR
jgi:hypothetical protein